MSDIERARIRKEAADSVVAKPPREDDASGSAVRRYLGIALQQTLRRRRETVRKPAPPATASPPEAKGAPETKSTSEDSEQRP
ncbi:hypothetical protein [Pedococcus bigeumensis]|uniref:hypothetical protein n=1 Tax=Pedococcus bigeumensis TaxID=433644 RepID=UPI002FE77A66